MKTILLSLFVFIISSISAQNSMYDICPIKNSEKIPDAKVFHLQGEPVILKEYIAERKVIIVFYRGGWCPYCLKHLSALQEVKSEIYERGYEMIAITPDDFKNLDSSVVKTNIDYTLFSDKNAEAINAFGIGWKVDEGTFEKYKEKYGIDLEFWSDNDHHTLPVPAVFVIEKGKIKYQHVDPNYSKRLSAEILLSFINE